MKPSRELSTDDIMQSWLEPWTFDEIVLDQVEFFRRAERSVWSCALDALLLR